MGSKSKQSINTCVLRLSLIMNTFILGFSDTVGSGVQSCSLVAESGNATGLFNLLLQLLMYDNFFLKHKLSRYCLFVQVFLF